ncbi:MAG: hypothetical protein ACOYM2_10585 [Rectinemataceae bacterium]
MAEYGEWNSKGASLSETTAQKGIRSQKEIAMLNKKLKLLQERKKELDDE